MAESPLRMHSITPSPILPSIQAGLGPVSQRRFRLLLTPTAYLPSLRLIARLYRTQFQHSSVGSRNTRQTLLSELMEVCYPAEHQLIELLRRKNTSPMYRTSGGFGLI